MLSGREPEQRSNSLENPSVSLVDPKAWAQIFGDWRSAAGVSVDANVAMSVPAVWCAVTFLSACIAALPIKVHRKSQNGKEQIERGPFVAMLTRKVNDEYLTSFNWRRDMMTSTLLKGRALTFAERRVPHVGDASQLWPIPLAKTTIKRQAGKLTYNYRETTSSKVATFTPDEIVDIKFLGQLDGVDHFDPVMQMKDTIGLGVALRTFASRYFLNGGVPPLALEGPAASPAATARAKSDVGEAVKQSTRDESNVLYVPIGHKLTPLGYEPAKGQMIEAQQYVVTETSRMYNLPPAFLHQLINATFANVEQQDLNFVKHCLVAWVEQWEQELNVKLFGSAKGRYIEFDLAGLLRGDFLSRMQGYASAIQNGVMKPNEARRRENLPDADGGDDLLVNSTIQPLAPGDPATTGTTGGEIDNPGDPVDDPEDD